MDFIEMWANGDQDELSIALSALNSERFLAEWRKIVDECDAFDEQNDSTEEGEAIREFLASVPR
jgi:hypothetical protein